MRLKKEIATRKMCRNCLNREYGLRLTNKDCYYWNYEATCQNCKEIRNIVTGVHFFRRWKLWFK